jgi:hypothetical protein
MTTNAGNLAARRGSPWRIIGWGLAALILMLPLVAMRFTNEVNWTLGDFIFAALLIGVVGVTFELTVRVSTNWWHRGGVAFALAASFLIVWANGAVGMIGNEDKPYNLLFLGVILLALLGAILARFRPAGMALAMAVAAAAHGVVALVGMSSDLRGGIFSLVFAGPWLLSAALFWNAARDQRSTPNG